MKRIVTMIMVCVIVFNMVAKPAYAAEQFNNELEDIAQVMPLSATTYGLGSLLLGGAGGTASAAISGPVLLVVAMILASGFVVTSGPALAQLATDVWDNLSSQVQQDLEAIHLSGAIAFNVTKAIAQDVAAAIQKVFYDSSGAVIESVAVRNTVGIQTYDYDAQRVYGAELTDYQKEFYCYLASSTSVAISGTPYKVRLLAKSLSEYPSWVPSKGWYNAQQIKNGKGTMICFENSSTGVELYIAGPLISSALSCTKRYFSPICEGTISKVTDSETIYRKNYGIWVLSTCQNLANGISDVCSECGKGISDTHISEYFDLSNEAYNTNFILYNKGSASLPVQTKIPYFNPVWYASGAFVYTYYSTLNYATMETKTARDPFSYVLTGSRYAVGTTGAIAVPEEDDQVYVPPTHILNDIKNLTQAGATSGEWVDSETTNPDAGVEDGTTTDGIAGVLEKLFVPDMTELENVLDTYSGKFAWATTLYTFITSLFDSMNPTEPPVIHMDLSAANSKYDWGTDGIAFDMSWYAPYKDSVDTIISGIAWVYFLWRLFKRIPDVLSGYGIREN